ncbi:iron-sulfur cluster-binding protein [Nonomuraea helvata]|uniref:FAD-binding FR-type domain-containing protein n=1 Tax=Nonomuraea helvata TaxID=37484 RepID=A0ABV5SAF4_9ACTN
MIQAAVPEGTALETLPAGTDLRPAATSHESPILVHRHERDRYWRMILYAPAVARTALPGQFVMITPARRGESWPVLPRPMAVYDTDPDAATVTIVYGVVGDGTRHLSGFRAGESVVTVGPLGRPFTLAEGSRSLLVMGRGIGACSLTMLARSARAAGLKVMALASGRSPAATVGAGYYAAHGIPFVEAHDSDGSSDPAVLSSLLSEGGPWDSIAVCGSLRLTALAHRLGQAWDAEVLVSLEARMACGLGYCHGCSTGQQTAAAEAPLICHDGPVFRLVESKGAREKGST